MAEAENERAFSIREFVVGDRAARKKTAASRLAFGRE
jgi:hypothetical protein